MYSTKTAVVNPSTSNFMPAGINDNVTIKIVNVNVSPTGRNFLEIIFENEQGQEAILTEWKNEKNQWIKTDADLQRRDDLQFGRILQVLKCFGQEIPETEINSFKDMIDWVKQTIDNWKATNNPKLRLKVVYDNKGFTRVSSNGIFVEPMSVEESQIVLTGRDRTTRPEIPVDKETPTTDPLSAINTTPDAEVNSDDDLPF